METNLRSYTQVVPIKLSVIDRSDNVKWSSIIKIGWKSRYTLL